MRKTLDLNAVKSGFGAGLIMAVIFWMIVLVGLIGLPTPLRDYVHRTWYRFDNTGSSSGHTDDRPDANDPHVQDAPPGAQPRPDAPDPVPVGVTPGGTLPPDNPAAAPDDTTNPHDPDSPGDGAPKESTPSSPGKDNTPQGEPEDHTNNGRKGDTAPVPKAKRPVGDHSTVPPTPTDPPVAREKRGAVPGQQSPANPGETPKQKEPKSASGSGAG